MKFGLQDLVDIPRLQELTDRLYDAAGIPSAIIDMDGEILTGSGWQRICTDFHRMHPEIEKQCIQSDIAIRKQMSDGEPFTVYTCPRGLTDGSVPIVIEGEHLANAFAGQLFLEEPGEGAEETFREQARHFGLDEDAYVEAFRQVPVVSAEKFRASLLFLADLANMIAGQGLQRKRELEVQESLRQSEEKLRKTSALLQETEKSGRIGGWEFDPQTLVQTWTNEVFRILEIDTTSGAPKVPEGLSFIAPPYREMAEQAVQRALELGESYDQEWEVITAKENTRWVHSVGRVIESDGRIVSVRGSFQDITDRKRAEERLAHEQQLAQQYLDVAGVMLIALDVDGNVTLINPAGCRILGYAEDEIVGRNWFDEFLQSDNVDEVKAVFSMIVSGEEESGEYFENPILRKDGSQRIIAWHNSVFRDRDGVITGLFSSGEDITERKRATDDLRKSEERLRAVLDATPFPVAVVDTDDDKVHYWSRSALAIFGHTAPTASEWYELAYPDPEYRQEVVERWKPFLEVARECGKPVNTGEYRVTCADGTERICELWATFIPDRLIVTLNDVTDRKKAEEELRQFEWLLEKEGPPVGETSRLSAPAYQDPTQLNTSRVILDGIGREALDTMAGDLLDLLDTSVVIYEANGDYAHAVFDSDWCRLMDAASFELCGTDDVGEALACGSWLCHENCWNDSAKAAMENGGPTDIKCVGGIRLYAVPIRAGDEIIGSVCVGYSSPPRADEELFELSGKYQVDLDELRAGSTAYKPRPPFIIEVAKRSCRSVAKLIGQTIERQRTKAALTKTEAHHRTLVETIPDLVWVKDPDGVYLSCNRAFKRLFGATEAEIIGRTDRDFVDEELADFFRHHDRKAMEANQPVVNEEWLTFAADGYHGLFETIKTPMVDSGGNTIGVMGIAREITERNRIQDEIRAIANEQSWLLGSMINAFVIFQSVFDDAGNFTSYRFEYINKAYEGITGVRMDDVRGKTVHEVWPETEDSWVENYGKVATEGDPLTFNMYHGPTEKLYHCHAYRPWETRDRFCVVFEDITEQQRIEEEKARLETQLVQAQKMESIGRLAGGVAHDFNNLLTGIMGNVELAQLDLEPDEPLSESLDEIKSAATRAAELTNQLLAFSRKQIIQPKVINLNDLVSNLRKMLVRIIGEDLELMTIPQVGLGDINADPGQIEQVIVNLSINARDAMPNGGKLTIETADVYLDDDYCETNLNVEPGDHVMLAISDNGTGMDEEIKKRIFDPFFTTKKVGRGTGLGLAMAYGIVTQHGGSINVYTEVGEGTTFKIYFPLVDEKPEPIGQESSTPVLARGNESVLVVEDERVVRSIAVNILTRLGYEVISAEDGPGALAMIEERETPVDLLLTDVIMPKMNGRELAELVRQQYPETKILFTSGYTRDAIAHHGVLDEGLEFLGKPYSSQSLATKVRKVLDEA